MQPARRARVSPTAARPPRTRCDRPSSEFASARQRRGFDVSLRWVLVHMIEEYARHHGHAALLREGLDGVVGV